MKLIEILNEVEYDYRMKHTAPDKDENAPLYDLTKNGIYPDDVYSNKAIRYYGTGFADNETFSIIKRCKGNPDAIVTIYRAMPDFKAGSTGKSKTEKSKINPGDWVSITKEYAKRHKESNGNPDWTIVSKKVKASNIYTDGNSWDEWGYHL